MHIQRQALKSNNKKSKNSLWIQIKRHWILYLLFLPVFVYFVVFRYWPLYLQVVVSLKDFQLGMTLESAPWVGLENIRKAFALPEFYRVIRNTIEISLLRLVVGFLPPILLAILLNDIPNKWFRTISQTIIYFPHFLSWPIVYGIVFAFFASERGFINQALIHLGFQQYDFLTSSSFFRPLIIGSALWKELGWSTIIYMAALSTVDPNLYEAAMIDGAGPIQRIIHITIPSILPVMIFILTISLGSILYAGFEQILIFMNNATMNVGDIIDTWVYREGLLNYQFSLGTAVGFFQSVIGLFLVLIANYVSRRYAGIGIW